MRILSLDLGSTSVKAVEIDSAFGRYEIHEYHEKPVSRGLDPAIVAGELYRSLLRKPDKVIVNIPTQQITFRNLHLPTKDKKALKAALTFELEDDLPFSLDEAVYASQVLAQGASGTHIHIVTTLKKYVADLIARLTYEGVDPDVITSESWAYRAFFNRALPREEQEKPILFINIKFRTSTFYIHWNGYPVFSRQIPWGGQNFTEAIAVKYKLSDEEAEKAKLDNGFILTPSQRESATLDQKKFSSLMEKELDLLIREIRQIDLTSKSTTQHHLDRIYISGKSSLVPGICEAIQERTKVPATRLGGLSAISGAGVTYSEVTDSAFLLAGGLAISMARGSGTKYINLRKGELEKGSGSRGLQFQTLKKPLMGAAAVLVMMFLSLTVQSNVYESKLAQIESVLKRQVKSYLGITSSSAVRKYMGSPKRLEREIKNDIAKKRELGRLLGGERRSPMILLDQISRQISKRMTVDLIEYEVGGNAQKPFSTDEPYQAKLTFLVKEKDRIPRLEQILGRSLEDLTKVSESKVDSLYKDDSEKVYRVTFTGKTSEG